MEVKTYKIFSLCNDFGEDEDLYEQLSAEVGCDTYITYPASSRESLISKGYDEDPVSIRLVELGADDGEEVLIHIDY